MRKVKKGSRKRRIAPPNDSDVSVDLSLSDEEFEKKVNKKWLAKEKTGTKES